MSHSFEGSLLEDLNGPKHLASGPEWLDEARSRAEALRSRAEAVSLSPEEGQNALRAWLDYRLVSAGVESSDYVEELRLMVGYLGEYIDECTKDEGDRQLQYIALAMRRDMEDKLVGFERSVRAGLTAIALHANTGPVKIRL